MSSADHAAINCPLVEPRPPLGEVALITVERLLHSPRAGIRHAGPVAEERLERFESIYELRLPVTYREFVMRHGDLHTQSPVDIPLRILGFADQEDPKQMARTLAGLRSAVRGFPTDLIPLEALPGGQFACIESGEVSDPRVIHIDIENPESWKERLVISISFSRFLLRWLNDAQSMMAIWAHAKEMDERVRRGERHHDQSPRADEWRSYRYCSQDVIVGESLLRYDRRTDKTLVGAFSATWLPWFRGTDPARAVLTNIMAEAYRSSARPSIRFVQGASNEIARTPDVVLAVAEEAGLHLNPNEAVIGGEQFSRLFVHVAGLPHGLRRRIENSSAINPDAIAYAVANGIWSGVEAECLFNWAHEPDRILQGSLHPINRVAYVQDLRDIRRALLVRLLINRLRAPAAKAAGPVDQEDGFTAVEIAFTREMAEIRCGTPVPIDWTLDGEPLMFDCFKVEVVVEDAERLEPAVSARTSRRKDGRPFLLLVPRDVLNLPDEVRRHMVAEARERSIRILVAPLYTSTLDVTGAQRLGRSRQARA